MAQLVLRRIVVTAALAVSACATPGPIQTADVGAIRSGVAAARDQAGVVFAGANDLARVQAIERKIRLPEPILRQQDFPEIVSAASARDWNAALGVLDDYAAALQNLVGLDRARDTGDAIGKLGDSLNAVSIKVPSGLVAVFQTFGRALVQSRAEREAASVMKATDPAFNDVIGRMATAIGQPDEPGSLASVVSSGWDNSVLPLIENDYGRLAATDLAGRRQVASAYVEAMGLRDRQVGEMIALQRSLLAVGAIHRAAAAGRPGDALFWIGRINEWVDDAKARMETPNGGTAK